MFLDRIIMENVGPIDRLDIKLPFNEKSGLVSGNPNFDNKAPIIPIA